MAGGQEKWYFTKEQLQNSPSRRCGLDADKELAYRQQAANLIQDMGQRLQVEEQPRKLEYVIKVAHVCLHRGEGVNALTSEQYQEQAQDLVFNENVLLQTLGFDVAIDHPHTHVVRTCHLVKAPKDLAQTSYFMASNSLHLTTMCLQYRPTVVACFCIHLASKWSNWSIPQSHEGRHWFSYVDRSVTSELLERLTAEFLHIFDKCPSRLKRKMMTMSNNSGSSPHSNAAHPSSSAGVANSPFDKKHPPPNSDEFDKSFDKEYERERRRQPGAGGYVPATAPPAANPPQPQKIDYNLYREKREREERERRQAALQQARPSSSQQPRPPGGSQPPPHHQRPSSSQHHHKPHHAWPHHKPPHHKPPHDKPPHDKPPHEKSSHEKPHEKPPHEKPSHEHRHHRPQAPPTTTAAPVPHPPQPEQIPQRTRPPSLFSPENATTPTAAAAAAPRRPQPSQPQSREHRLPRPESRPLQQPPSIPASIQQPHNQPVIDQRPSSPHKKRPDPTAAIREMQPPAILSPFSSPPAKEPTPKPRQRAPSNSEPELIPVVKKLDETPGYENVIRDSQRGNTIRSRPPEQRKPEPVRSLNGIETDPTLVSNLLKESLAKPAPITVQTERKSPVEVKREPVMEPPAPVQLPPQPEPPAQPLSQEEADHKHKKEKKKKDKHKHKDRDKSKEERKKHKKDKEREKKLEPSPQPPPAEPLMDGALRITIPRDKLSTSPGLKIKIPKERLAAPPPPPQPSAGLKIKISKEVLETSRKRTGVPEPGPPPKMPRQNGAPHHKVGNWNVPPPYRPPLPYYMVQPPPPLYFGMGMDGYFYGGMYGPPQPRPQMSLPQPPRPPHPPQPRAQPPLPAMPPPPVPPPPPE
ncbi:Cyclin-T [Papilio xuthus]|uniref:Cyclin-T n=1 Tax=Papilio xuthus TaxID=66420 RepID=A0A194PT52_PAPXU|nr:Cyclin-T [Papilio xuthus]